MRFILRWIATSVAIAAAIYFVDGLALSETANAIISVLVLGLVMTLVNMAIKPILQFLSLPITVLTLGVFYLVVNTILLYLAAFLANGLFFAGIQISSFGSAFLASIIISIVSSIANWLLGGIEKAARRR